MDGLKYDDGKAPLHLIDMDVLIDVANVFAYGAIKYDEHNWRKGMKLTRLLNASMRHIAELQKGVDIDPESNLSHSAHAIADLIMFSALLRDMPVADDRYRVKTSDEKQPQQLQIPVVEELKKTYK